MQKFSSHHIIIISYLHRQGCHCRWLCQHSCTSQMQPNLYFIDMCHQGPERAALILHTAINNFVKTILLKAGSMISFHQSVTVLDLSNIYCCFLSFTALFRFEVFFRVSLVEHYAQADCILRLTGHALMEVMSLEQNDSPSPMHSSLPLYCIVRKRQHPILKGLTLFK